MADTGITGGSWASGLPSSDSEVLALKRSLQDLRRQLTLLNADMQMQIEAREAVQAQLMEAHIELAASRDRRKEMARVITNREEKITNREEKIAVLYGELAAMQRYVMRRSPVGWFKMASRAIRRMFRKPPRSA